MRIKGHQVCEVQPGAKHVLGEMDAYHRRRRRPAQESKGKWPY